MNVYYIGGLPVTDELYHYGVKGQRHGYRRYQDEKGRLTVEGRRHYGVGPPLDPSNQGEQTNLSIKKSQSTTEINDRASIVNAQRSLQNLGYNLNRYGADGKIGEETRAAINAFKKDHGLAEDGKLDYSTSRMMNDESNSSLKKGASGDNVVKMQDALKSLGYELKNYGSDGKFGAETQKALNEFKKAHGLPENGIYDGITRSAMAKELSVKSNSAKSQLNDKGMINTQQQSSPSSLVNESHENAGQNIQVQPEVPSPQTDGQTDAEQESARKQQDENKRIRQKGDKITEQILKSLNDAGSQIAKQHKALSDSISKVSGKAGSSMSKSAQKIASAASSALSSIKAESNKRAKIYDNILDASRTVSVSAIQARKDIRLASDRLVKQHNKLISELTDLSREGKKTVKKTGKSVERFFKSAKKTMDRGSKVLESWFLV